MLNEIFYYDFLRQLLIMSASGGAVALILFALKPLIRNKLPKAVQYYLWLIVLAAFVLPVSQIVRLPADSLPSDAQGTPITLYETVERYAITSEEARDKLQSDAEFFNNYQDLPENAAVTVMDILAVVYPFGAAAVLLYNAFAYALFRRKIRRHNVLSDIDRTDCKVPVYRNSTAATPMLIGLFKPVIVLPDNEYTTEQLHSVLLHELTHYRRHDIFIKWLSVLACAVHWFNPLAWLTRRAIDRACELACDAAVIRELDAGGKQLYGDTLIEIAATPPFGSGGALAMYTRKASLKERLGAIMAHKKVSRPAVVLSVALLVIVGAATVLLGAGKENGLTDWEVIIRENLLIFRHGNVELVSQGHPPDYEISGDPVVSSKLTAAARGKYIGIVNDPNSNSGQKWQLWECKGYGVDEWIVVCPDSSPGLYAWAGAVQGSVPQTGVGGWFAEGETRENAPGFVTSVYEASGVSVSFLKPKGVDSKADMLVDIVNAENIWYDELMPEVLNGNAMAIYGGKMRGSGYGWLMDKDVLDNGIKPYTVVNQDENNNSGSATTLVFFREDYINDYGWDFSEFGSFNDDDAFDIDGESFYADRRSFYKKGVMAYNIALKHFVTMNLTTIR